MEKRPLWDLRAKSPCFTHYISPQGGGDEEMGGGTKAIRKSELTIQSHNDTQRKYKMLTAYFSGKRGFKNLIYTRYEEID